MHLQGGPPAAITAPPIPTPALTFQPEDKNINFSRLCFAYKPKMMEVYETPVNHRTQGS